MAEAAKDELVLRTLILLNEEQHDWLRQRVFDRRTLTAAEVRELVERERRVDTSSEGAASTVTSSLPITLSLRDTLP